MKFLHHTAVVIFVALLLVLPAHTVFASKAMPSFSLVSARDGEKVSSEILKDKTLLVAFFATWCPPCRQEVPVLIKLHEELSDKEFSVVAISADEGGRSVVQKLIELEKINYPVFMADEKVLDGFGVSGIPTSFLVNAKGNVVKSYAGYIPEQTLRRDIEAAMQP
jgi:thiol-disulfide isomerase/thioredoxin